MKAMKRASCLAVLFIATIAASQSEAPKPDRQRVPYTHAYYLFISGAFNGCEDCYVPLVISQHSLEEIAQGKEAQPCALIYTYERNSIWEIRGALPIDPGAIETQPRIIHVNGKSYRYQEVSPGEVLKLLENPAGTIPISRPLIINKVVPDASLNELIADFRDLVRLSPKNQER
jgi:hypothetical protein